MPTNSGSNQDSDFFRPIWRNKWHEWQERSRENPVFIKVLRAIVYLARRSTPTQVPTHKGLVTVPVGSMFGTRRRIAAEASCSVKSVGRALKFWVRAKVIKTEVLYARQKPGVQEIKREGLLITVLDWNSAVAQANGVSGNRAGRPGRERADEEGQQAAQSPGENEPRSTALDPATLTFEDRDWDRYRAIFAAVPEALPANEQDEWNKARQRLIDEQKKVLKERVAAEAQDSPS